MNKSKMGLYGCGIVGSLMFLLLFVAAVAWNGLRVTNNNYVNELEACQDTMAFNLDKVTKVISQKADVTGKYSDDVKEVVVKAMEARYKTGGEMFKAVQEASGQQLDPSLYKDLSQAIETQRDGFLQAQSTARDHQREQNLLIDNYGFFLPGAKKIKLKYVTSADTKQSFETGEENDTKLFKK
jgi:hypothetical protein